MNKFPKKFSKDEIEKLLNDIKNGVDIDSESFSKLRQCSYNVVDTSP